MDIWGENYQRNISAFCEIGDTSWESSSTFASRNINLARHSFKSFIRSLSRIHLWDLRVLTWVYCLRRQVCSRGLQFFLLAPAAPAKSHTTRRCLLQIKIKLWPSTIHQCNRYHFLHTPNPHPIAARSLTHIYERSKTLTVPKDADDGEFYNLFGTSLMEQLSPWQRHLKRW